ncbi:hypothetical protein GR316_10685 [Falsirhodobacter algicola]|uniref:CatB-related O-acetyltransferase n=1 Tax=Falsirhodobacter algicola TaxID=2692330 RepID=A0A8J8MV40_9RHOB|nr:hypothetical protein GR316_10685 [Falsirhodobacter algicola]
MGAFSIMRTGASAGPVSIGRFAAVGANFVCAPPEHPLDSLGTSSVFLKSYGWAQGDDGFYDVPRSSRRLLSRQVDIGCDVWIGRDVLIKGGVKIGHGSIVAARSVVTKDVPPYSIVAGSPARLIRMRFDEEICQNLLEVKWWDLDPSWMKGVDQTDVRACLNFLNPRIGSIDPLMPGSVVFGDTDYEIHPGRKA